MVRVYYVYNLRKGSRDIPGTASNLRARFNSLETECRDLGYTLIPEAKRDIGTNLPESFLVINGEPRKISDDLRRLIRKNDLAYDEDRFYTEGNSLDNI